MRRRSYGQHCGLAYALDLVGERWTLLILRELVGGPKRYKDLLQGLPGIGTGMLATRLKTLSDNGIVRRSTLPPPSGSQVYELTELGRELEPVLVELVRFGQHWLDRLHEGESFRPTWLPLSLRARFRPDAAHDIHETYELRLEDGVVVRVAVHDGNADIAEGAPAGDADLVLETDSRTILELFSRELTPRDAVNRGRLAVQGEPDALRRFARMFEAPASERLVTAP